MEFRVVVWNLRGLSLISKPERLQRAKDAFRTLVSNNETVAFALVELGPDPNSILEDLANHLGDGWMHYFGAGRGGNSEIGLLLQTKRLSAATLKLSTPPHDYSTGEDIKMGRIPAALFLVHRDEKPVFLLAVVHFKAKGTGSEHYTRKSLAALARSRSHFSVKVRLRYLEEITFTETSVHYLHQSVLQKLRMRLETIANSDREKDKISCGDYPNGAALSL